MTHSYDDAFLNFSMAATDAEINTIDGTSNNQNLTRLDSILEHLVVTLNVFYTPLVIFLGIIGNLISLIVFFKSKLRVQSTSQYLSALALSDTLFLCQLLPPWLKALGASSLFTQSGFCQLFVYFSYVACNLSAWLVVSFTIERFVAVVYPLRRNAMCTVKRARLIIISLATFSLLLNLPVLRFAVPHGDDCNIDELLMIHAARFNLMDTAITFTLPLAVIVVLNIWIMFGVYNMSSAQPNLMRQHQMGHTRAPHLERVSASQRSQQRVTRMLLIVSSVFVLLNLPAYTMRVVAYANNMGENEYIGKWAALQQICLLFFNTNFGINFALYCMTGQNFRRALQETFPWLRRRNLALAVLRCVDVEQDPRASSVSTSYGQSFSNTDNTTNCALHTSVINTPGVRSGVRAAEFGLEVDRTLRRNWTARAESPNLTRHRRRRTQKVIQRWRFDNSRQQRRESFEMQPLPAHDVRRTRHSVPQTQADNVHSEHSDDSGGSKTMTGSTWM